MRCQTSCMFLSAPLMLPIEHKKERPASDPAEKAFKKPFTKSLGETPSLQKTPKALIPKPKVSLTEPRPSQASRYESVCLSVCELTWQKIHFVLSQSLIMHLLPDPLCYMNTFLSSFMRCARPLPGSLCVRPLGVSCRPSQTPQPAIVAVSSRKKKSSPVNFTIFTIPASLTARWAAPYKTSSVVKMFLLSSTHHFFFVAFSFPSTCQSLGIRRCVKRRDTVSRGRSEVEETAMRASNCRRKSAIPQVMNRSCQSQSRV